MYEVFTTKPGGDSNNRSWKWVLTSRGSGLTRKEAGRLAHELRGADKTSRVVVYAFGTFRHSLS